MDAVVLETDVLGPASQSRYDDSLTGYQFPARYLKHFSPLSEATDMLAVIYEPRGNPPVGRMAYVGWAMLRGSPRRDPSRPDSIYTVDCLEPMRSFERPVPREVDGEPIERWLRDLPRGHHRNSATRGRAVRRLAANEVEDIFRLGATDLTWDTVAGAAEDRDLPHDGEVRLRRLVERLERSTAFRQAVLAAYGGRCAISGLSSDGIEGLVEAAHIRGVGRPEFGPDHITNGIALTPTLHRIFDRHLFSFRYEGDDLVVVLSRGLTADMVQSSITGSQLSLQQGQRVWLPSSASARPSRKFINFHRSQLLT